MAKPDPSKWELFTPHYDYVKEPYWARTPAEPTPVLCYPNAGLMNAMGGSGRIFGPCECEVQFAGWEEDEHHPATVRARKAREVANG
jgi:hypothetical protein